MRIRNLPRKVLIVAAVAAAGAIVAMHGCALFESERVAKGRSIYQQYCMHCHGENGRQNEGYNWIHMPDPRPRDLSIKVEMETFKDEEIFHTIYRDMKDTSPEGGDHIGEDEFAVPTMPTFKYTLSEEEIWSVVAYVRSLHGTSLTFDVEAKVQELRNRVEEAKQVLADAKKTLEAAEQKAEEAAEASEDDEELEDATLAEEEAVESAEMVLAEAKEALENFTKRPRFPNMPRPELHSVASNPSQKLVERGKRLYFNKYGCNACHSLDGQGGVVGPALDRAGFRLNDAWIYRWVRYPQGFKRKTKMPNLGVDDADARAITAYLKTLRAPKSEERLASSE